jgi:hypothetical protein
VACAICPSPHQCAVICPVDLPGGGEGITPGLLTVVRSRRLAHLNSARGGIKASWAIHMPTRGALGRFDTSWNLRKATSLIRCFRRC